MSSLGEVRSQSQPNLNDPEIEILKNRKRTKSESFSGLLGGLHQIEETLNEPITLEKIKQATELLKMYFPKEVECSEGEELGTSFNRWGAMMSNAKSRESAIKAISAAKSALSLKESDFKI